MQAVNSKRRTEMLVISFDYLAFNFDYYAYWIEFINTRELNYTRHSKTCTWEAGLLFPGEKYDKIISLIFQRHIQITNTGIE